MLKRISLSDLETLLKASGSSIEEIVLKAEERAGNSAKNSSSKIQKLNTEIDNAQRMLTEEYRELKTAQSVLAIAKSVAGK